MRLALVLLFVVVAPLSATALPGAAPVDPAFLGGGFDPATDLVTPSLGVPVDPTDLPTPVAEDPSEAHRAHPIVPAGPGYHPLGGPPHGSFAHQRATAVPEPSTGLLLSLALLGLTGVRRAASSG